MQQQSYKVYRGPEQSGKHYLQLMWQDTKSVEKLADDYAAKNAGLLAKVIKRPTPHITLVYGIKESQFDAIADAVDRDLSELKQGDLLLDSATYKVSPAHAKTDFVCVDVIITDSILQNGRNRRQNGRGDPRRICMGTLASRHLVHCQPQMPNLYSLQQTSRRPTDVMHLHPSCKTTTTATRGRQQEYNLERAILG